MRPEAYKNVSYKTKAQDTEAKKIGLAVASHVLLYINLFCLIFLTLTVLSTRRRVLDFFETAQIILPTMSKNLLSISSFEYMSACIMAAFVLVAKERFESKKVSFVLNVAMLLGIWSFQFLYVWAISTPLTR
ncbi:MAG: hypothetical protein GY858_03695 [Candidatus Omnitrophica bacterium]|nr:hypothetical protein [Candidatus Omnitrophota bacterium]